MEYQCEVTAALTAKPLMGLTGKRNSPRNCVFGFSPPYSIDRESHCFILMELQTHRVRNGENIRDDLGQCCCLTDAKMEAQRGCLTCSM